MSTTAFTKLFYVQVVLIITQTSLYNKSTLT